MKLDDLPAKPLAAAGLTAGTLLGLGLNTPTGVLISGGLLAATVAFGARARLRVVAERPAEAEPPGLAAESADPPHLEGAPAREPEPAPPAADVLDMVPIPAGEFVMGSNDFDDEKPPHRVRLDGFLMARTTTTNAEYRRVVPEHAPGEADDLPATRVSWFDAARFCNALSREAGFTEAYDIEENRVTWRPKADGYRLPTEAEWEYACRAGTTTDFSFGNDREKLSEYAWFGDNGGVRAHPVAQNKPNPWGLYDLHGNVWEWVFDPYGPYTNVMTTTGDVTHAPCAGFPTPPVGADRVLRGGSAWGRPEFLRSAYRFRYWPVIRLEYVGFRCVRSPRR